VRSSEVNDLDLAAVFDVDQNILWLEVTMGNLLTVAISNRLQKLLEHNSSLSLAEVVALGDLVK